jgi:PEGA domain
MSAPATDLFSSSISSSGHVDGLGRRTLGFDRETGGILERVHVRPELAVFEQILRRRVEHLSRLEEERFARPSAVTRDPATGELMVVAEFVAGIRLSDLLEVSADSAVVPGVDVALGYLLEALPALSALHTTNRTTHGLIDPSRTVLTAEGQAVFLDVAFGSAVERLHLSPQRLWTEFGVSTSSGAGPVVFDAACDVTQAALGALMLVLGRNLRPAEYPDALPTLLMEVIEVAHIRGSTSFATGLQRILQRALPLPGRRAYTTADEALVDVRQLVRREIGLDACRQAIIDFVAQMDAAIVASANAEKPSPAAIERPPTAPASKIPELDLFLETIEARDASEPAAPEQRDTDDSEDDGEELEISLDQFEQPAPVQAEEIYDLPALDDPSLSDPRAFSSELASFGAVSTDARSVTRHADVEPEPPIRTSEEEPAAEHAIAEVPFAQAFAAAVPVEPPSEREAVTAEAEPHAALVEQAPAAETPASDPEPPTPIDEPEAPIEAAAPVVEPFAAAAPVEPAATPQPQQLDAEQQAEKESASSRRRKRQQQKSARARKDKLRSTTADQKVVPAPPAPPPPPPPARPATPSGWLVLPQRPAAAESLIPEPMRAPAPPPPPPPPRQVPAVPSFAPTPVGQLPQPTYTTPSSHGSPYGAPTVVKPVPPPPPTPPPPPQVASGQLKVKPEPPAGFNTKKPTMVEPVAMYSGPDRFSTLSLGRPQEEETTRPFPWKLAAVAVAVAAVAIGVGRTYLPGRTAVAGEPGAQVESGAASEAGPASETAGEKPDTPIPAGRGRINIRTEPAGIKVLLDRKPVGETPVIVDAAPGRRVLTFLTSGGEVMHSVRVVAGKTVPLDVPVFSGWVSIVAPVLLEISEGGRSLGTTEQNRLMLPPGRHQITLSNKDLGYSEVKDVDIEPGGVRSITVNPRGSANMNATPWAEVWLDGNKLGETPLSNIQVPLGLHEFVFKHPQFGERRVSATIRSNAPAALAVDFTK